MARSVHSSKNLGWCSPTKWPFSRKLRLAHSVRFLPLVPPSSRTEEPLEVSGIQYNTTKAFIMHAWSAGRLNLRHEQSLGGKTARCGSKIRHGIIICLKVPLKRGKRRAIANLERKFIPYWRCLDCQWWWKLQALRASVYPETGDCDPEYKEQADEWHSGWFKVTTL